MVMVSGGLMVIVGVVVGWLGGQVVVVGVMAGRPSKHLGLGQVRLFLGMRVLLTHP